MYQRIFLEDLNSTFQIRKIRELYELKTNNRDKPINIKLPFSLNEDVATFAGMFPDGSIIKDLKRIYFTQKKDDRQIRLFGRLLKKLFRPKSKIFFREGHNAKEVFINSQTLAIFCYKILGMNKSDEEMRVPRWVYNSKKSVIRSYLKQAFNAEAYVAKNLREIRFITKDHNYAQDLQKLLLLIDINSKIQPRIGGGGIRPQLQYRLSIYGKENFRKFKDVGFSIPLHKKRLEKMTKFILH